MAGSTYSVDVSLDTSTPQPPAPLLPLKTRPVALDVNPFYLEQLRTPPAQLDTFNARKARDAARNVGDIVPLMRSSSVKLGLYQENSACYVTLIACDLMLEFAVGTCFTALCFASFGVPLPFAIAVGVAMGIPQPLTWLNFRNGYRNGQWWIVYTIPFAKELEAAYEKNQGLPSISTGLFWTVVLLVLSYFAFWNTVVVNEKGETDPAYRVGVLAITVLTLLKSLNPLTYHFNLVLNSLFVVLPKTSTQLVDTYCSELKRVLLDAAGEDAQRATDAEKQGITASLQNVRSSSKVIRLEELHQNFAALYRLAHGNKTIYDSLIQFFLTLGGILSLVCIFWSTADEPQESKTARIVVGILMSLFLWSYVVGMFNGEVASSLRWEQVIRQHLSGPVVAEEALKLGCFRSLGDFDFWLRERHDVRGELMFGIRVDHHRVAQMVSLLASGLVVSVGYGIRSLFE